MTRFYEDRDLNLRFFRPWCQIIGSLWSCWLLPDQLVPYSLNMSHSNQGKVSEDVKNYIYTTELCQCTIKFKRVFEPKPASSPKPVVPARPPMAEMSQNKVRPVSNKKPVQSMQQKYAQRLKKGKKQQQKKKRLSKAEASEKERQFCKGIEMAKKQLEERRKH